MVFLLAAFVMNLTGRLSEDAALYSGMNCAGALLLAFYAWSLGSYPFLVLEIVWAGSAGYKLVSIQS